MQIQKETMQAEIQCLATMIDNNRILVLGGRNEKNFDQATSILINIGSSPSYESQKLDHWNVETFRQSY